MVHFDCMRTLRAGAVFLLLTVFAAVNAECAMRCVHACCHKCEASQSLFTTASVRPPAPPPQCRAAAAPVDDAGAAPLQPAPDRVSPVQQPPGWIDRSSAKVLRV